MKKEKILVTGSTGLLGSHLHPYLCSKGYEVIGVSKEHRINSQNHVDFTDKSETYSFLDKTEPSIIINLISLTSVEECESNPERAVKLNVIVVENIVSWISKNRNVHLIQLSTDHVYDGVGHKTETNINITNKYAETKFAGERVAERVNSTILRTNFVGKSKSVGCLQ
jgi:dTDP-4-dehydrorhamnose reductase